MSKYLYKSYDSLFPKLYLQEKNRLNTIPGVIEHVGSTSIPGMGGKGIIDIGLGISFADLDNSIHRLEELGYTYCPKWSVEDRKFLKMEKEDPLQETRLYHLHLTKLGSQEWKSLLHFRDHLIQHPEAAKAYADLKKQASLDAKDDGTKYRTLKDPFIQQIINTLRHLKT